MSLVIIWKKWTNVHQSQYWKPNATLFMFISKPWRWKPTGRKDSNLHKCIQPSPTPDMHLYFGLFSNLNLDTKFPEFLLGIFPSLLQMYIDLTGPTVTAIPVKYDPHKKIVPLLAALYHTWVFIKRYFVDFQISRCLLRALEICKLAKRQSGKVIATKTSKFIRGMKTVENSDFFGWWGTFRWGGLMDILVQHTKAPPLWNKFSQFSTFSLPLFHISQY